MVHCVYLQEKRSDLHKSFSKCHLVNSDVIYVKIIQPVNKHSLVLMT